jgi:hypothetical protein
MRVPTVGVAMPTQDATFCADKPRNATRHDGSKAAPIVAAPTQDAIGSEHESVKPQDTTLANGRRASRRRLRIPHLRT